LEGHADSTPPGPTIKERWPSNWELSSARAAAVIRFLVEQGVAESRFELVSYAATRPVAPNDTPQSRARNRRVIIVAR
jgi:chemotaxis protein MotB